MCGQPRHDTQLHTRLTSSFLGLDVWMTLKLNVALIHKLRRSCLVVFLTCYPLVLYNKALADAPLTGAGHGCLYIPSFTCGQNMYKELWYPWEQKPFPSTYFGTLVAHVGQVKPGEMSRVRVALHIDFNKAFTPITIYEVLILSNVFLSMCYG